MYYGERLNINKVYTVYSGLGGLFGFSGFLFRVCFLWVFFFLFLQYSSTGCSIYMLGKARTVILHTSVKVHSCCVYAFGVCQLGHVCIS